MKILSSVLIIIILFFILSAAILLVTPVNIQEKVVEIRKGDSALQIAQRLYDRKVIRSKYGFYLYVKLTGSEKLLSYGKYLFYGDLTLSEVVDKLVAGEVVLHKITIPEALTLKKTCRLLARKGFGDYSKFQSLCTDSTFAKKLTGFSIPSLEGFLYPETYHFPEDVTEEYIISHLVRRFFLQTADLDFKPNYSLDYYETIILASIVEKEARVRDEKPVIASVYLNRIENDMKLQADPTVAYVLEQNNKHRKKIYYRDLKIESPYNTYLYKGLPPTPICNPSVSAIQAVLNPDDTDYFFFFANNRGRHIFSQTYSQHLSKQRELKGKYGK